MGQYLETIMQSVRAAAVAFSVDAPTEDHVQACLTASEAQITKHKEIISKIVRIRDANDAPHWVGDITMHGINNYRGTFQERLAYIAADEITKQTMICVHGSAFNDAAKNVLTEDSLVQEWTSNHDGRGHFNWLSYAVYEHKSTCSSISEHTKLTEKLAAFEDSSRYNKWKNKKTGTNLRETISEIETKVGANFDGQARFCASIKGTYNIFTEKGEKGGLDHLRDASQGIRHWTQGRVGEVLKLP